MTFKNPLNKIANEQFDVKSWNAQQVRASVTLTSETFPGFDLKFMCIPIKYTKMCRNFARVHKV